MDEADLEETEAGLVPTSEGWFVINARDARWFDEPGQGHSLPLPGYDEYRAETFFPMLGMAIRVVLHVDFEAHLRPFYFDACGFAETDAGLINLRALPDD